MDVDVRLYSYFLERRASDKRWVATVGEFPDLVTDSVFRARALNDLQDRVAEAVRSRLRAGEPIPPVAHPPQDLLSSFGLTPDDVGLEQ